MARLLLWLRSWAVSPYTQQGLRKQFRSGTADVGTVSNSPTAAPTTAPTTGPSFGNETVAPTTAPTVAGVEGSSGPRQPYAGTLNGTPAFAALLKVHAEDPALAAAHEYAALMDR